MKISSIRAGAFTLVETMVAGSVFTILTAGLMIYTSSTVRMAARNLATNHSHETARGSLERLWAEVHKSASRFQLIDFNGTTYTDVTATVSTDQDAYTRQYASSRANGVRFMQMAGGPYKLTGTGASSTVTATDTTLEFDFSGGKYTPGVGDQLQIPLINRDFDIVAPAPVRTSGNKWKVNVGKAIGFSVITAPGVTTSGLNVANPIAVAVFYKRVGYTVRNNQLRFHPRLTNPPYPAAVAATDVPVVIRGNVTSPKPFSLLFPAGAGALSDAANLRVSLEAYDGQYGERHFRNGTTTVQAVIPSRSQPPILSGN